MTYLTPEEARGELCPFFTYRKTTMGREIESTQSYYVHANCTGPACLIAWRGRSDGKGYCGMAGQPIERTDDDTKGEER